MGDIPFGVGSTSLLIWSCPVCGNTYSAKSEPGIISYTVECSKCGSAIGISQGGVCVVDTTVPERQWKCRAN